MEWKNYKYLCQTRSDSRGYVYRPLIEVEVSGKNEHPRLFKGLIDSGSEITMMDTEVAKLLGIVRDPKRVGTASGVGGGKNGFLGSVHLRIAGFEEIITSTVLFVDDLGLDLQILLGQDDFFRRFQVCFDGGGRSFSLSLAR